MTFSWRYSKSVLLCCCLFLSAISHADENRQSLSAIVDAAVKASQKQAAQLGYKHVSVETRPLDNRLNLPTCSEPLKTSMANSNNVLGPISVGVQCTGIRPWTIYVRAQVSALQPVPVLTKSLNRNTVITRQDLELVNMPLNSTATGMITDAEQIIGMELVRPMAKGDYLRAKLLRAPKVIKRGQQVALTVNYNGLSIRGQGKAMADAIAGESIRVTNTSSGIQVEGIALPDGTVVVR